ncbi:MAG: LON peptidase substrate-binding domain-containing protein [Acidimicrobiaceae bacterium]|nr:LON peptidase substrate-binding domain-containing protein [Acidimicrobiaceae bacterium]
MASAATPMFALQSVLLPGSPLPLHVFEPRYVAMLDTVISTDQEMGVVLIERGREVGGGDVRCDVATMARVMEARQLADGRLLVMALGVHRIRVRRWLPDDPHPCAETEDWPDEPEDDSPRADEVLPPLAGLVSEARSLALRLEHAPGPRPEAAEPAPVDLGSDLAQASYRAAALAPLGPLDRYEVLCSPGANQRLAVAHRVVSDAVELLRARIELGTG